MALEHATTVNSIHRSSDTGSSTVLVSRLPSVAFDTVEHNILIRRLGTSFGVTGLVSTWLQSHLSEHTRTLFTLMVNLLLQLIVLKGVPQSPLLGPLQFSVYTSPAAGIANSFDVSQRHYANDTQLLICCSFPY